MQCDQKRKADAENGQRNQEMTVSEDCPDFSKIGHESVCRYDETTGATIKMRRRQCQPGQGLNQSLKRRGEARNE
jgi:hypothetical protein